jgi:pimeloyl-ACP methyl ester carboxylesterase
MSDTYVLVHGAWHTGDMLEPVAEQLRAGGALVHCPTSAGNRAGDQRSDIGLREAIASLVDYLQRHDLRDVRLVGHSFGGMLISGAVDALPERIRRLVYVNAFVPLSGECALDMAPPHYRVLFESLAKANDDAVMLPFPIWREAFINDADLALAEATAARLNAQPLRTLTEPIRMRSELALLPHGKSYLNCLDDISLPHSAPLHPRLSERLGLFRLVQCPGSHELLFTNPVLLAQKIREAARD